MQHSMAASFTPGVRVVLHGLISRPEYNGQAGIVQCVDGSTGRCVVKMPDGQECSLCPDNLKEECPNQAQCSASARCLIAARVILHGLVSLPQYNSRVGIVCKPVQSDTGRCTVALCSGGEEVSIRTHNLKDASDAEWSAAATGADAALEVVLKAVAFLSKFKSVEQSDLIAKMKVKNKFDFMREGSSMHARFVHFLQDAAATMEPPRAAAPEDSAAPSLLLTDEASDVTLPQISTFSFRWGKGQAHCVENEIFDPTDLEPQSHSSTDPTLLENSLFGSTPPMIFPVRGA